jgi:hypothetical protein
MVMADDKTNPSESLSRYERACMNLGSSLLRLNRLQQLNAPGIILDNEVRLLEQRMREAILESRP